LRKSLYVGNLASPDGQALEALLSRFGAVRYAAVAPGDRPPYHGVVEIQSEDDAVDAIRVLDGFEIDGAPLSVRWATPPEQTSCGHPAMFGAMNMTNGGGAAPPRAGGAGEHDTPAG
jgi:RNA recognition motif-containing protein